MGGGQRLLWVPRERPPGRPRPSLEPALSGCLTLPGSSHSTVPQLLTTRWRSCSADAAGAVQASVSGESLGWGLPCALAALALWPQVCGFPPALSLCPELAATSAPPSSSVLHPLSRLHRTNGVPQSHRLPLPAGGASEKAPRSPTSCSSPPCPCPAGGLKKVIWAGDLSKITKTVLGIAAQPFSLRTLSPFISTGATFSKP